ncbi:threonine/serine dehydratase [Piscirickettsia salmonis]|uniref:threonine/serine dehydratase n=1 Tax=Piscirickettsia salmonis TaxID=1238 RepID=UPI0016624CAD|nr:threonine/serine dehydratase [Piscirickettsia salmonis]QNR79333.1 threonine/serine dehydratase [Piscirickettsia salmonis]
MDLLTKIIAADSKIKSQDRFVQKTPLEKSLLLSNKLNCEVYLKCEHLQKTGSFKLRGALHKVLLMSENERQYGIVAASSGNHGLGVALAAQLGNIHATIYVPETASTMKLNAISSLGVDVIKVSSSNCLVAEQTARLEAVKNQQTFISPYNDLDVICGQGTIGLELIEQCNELDAVFIAVGGGGLISGIGHAIKATHPHIEVIGCWPEHSPALYDALNSGHIVANSRDDNTLSDGTAGGVEENTITLALSQSIIDKKVLVSEQEIMAAIRQIGEYERWIIEGAAGVAVAGLMKMADQYKNKKIAVILCGRNISFDKYLIAIS